MQKNQVKATLIAFLLSISMFSFAAVEVNAHTPPWTIVSYAYICATPTPVGVGQTVTVTFWIDTALPGSSYTNQVRRQNYQLIVTKPDGTNITQSYPTIADSTSIQSIKYTPDTVGTYTFTFNYPGQTYLFTAAQGGSASYTNDYFTPATAVTTLTVQEEPIPSAIGSYPLPTEYWTRPIEGQNNDWYTIGSNWLGAPFILGAGTTYGVPGAIQKDGIAPNTAHVVWTKPLQFGGIVGGNSTTVPGEGFYQGQSYNARFTNALIMSGILCYQEPYGNSGTGGDYVGVNLQTGKEVWRFNASATGTSLVPQFGLLYSYDMQNQQGVVPNGILVAPYSVGGTMGPFGPTGGVTYWAGYDPMNGKLTNMKVSNIPSGTAVAGPSGEYLIYSLTNLGTSTNPNWHLLQWNSTNIFTGNPYSSTINASLASTDFFSGAKSPWDFNVTLNLPKGSWSVGTAAQGVVPMIHLGDRMLLIQGSFSGHVGSLGASITTDPVNITCISLNPATRGQVLWTESYQQAPNNITRTIAGWDPDYGVLITEDKETFDHSGYSLTDGHLIWTTPTPIEPLTAWNFFSIDFDTVYNGHLYYAGGYSGYIYSINATTGVIEWEFGNGGEGNSTNSGFYTPYGAYPTQVGTIADGKLYLIVGEHQPNNPVYKNAHLKCINATTGKQIWDILDWGNLMAGGNAYIADGYLATDNTYDQQIYCYGRGPSQTTVSAPDVSAQLGQSVTIKGSVLDIAAGTKQNEQAARFPNGVAAVSDDSQTEWMQYVYMQKPRPTNTVGVQVTISVLDANGNYRDIGVATTNTDGFFSLNWKPDIEGTYTVYASFTGSESYWPSHAVTAFAVDPAAAAPSEPEYPQPVDNTALLYGILGGVIAAIVIGLAAVFLSIRKK